MANERLDVVGHRTEVKLQIPQDYANAYARVLSKQSYIKHVYIDRFNPPDVNAANGRWRRGFCGVGPSTINLKLKG